MGNAPAQTMMASTRPRRIQLTPSAAFKIYGFMPKLTIDWATVEQSPQLTMTSLYLAGLTVPDLQKLQPRLAEWYNAKKATIANIAELEGWGVNIPSECPCFKLIDCIKLSGFCPPQRMVEIGLTLDRLESVYGMQLRQMAMMPYSMRDWIIMGFDFNVHGVRMDPAAFAMVFKVDQARGYLLYENEKRQLQLSPGL